MIASIVFILILGTSLFFFARRVREIRANILLGRDVTINDNKGQRWSTMARVALGQSKMVTRPVAGIMHILIYVGFIIINLEVLEIIIDGIFNQHRIFAPFLGGMYDILIGSFEILALLVVVACVVFLIRRNGMKLKRFHSAEMTKWPKSDANYILIIELILMFAFLTMNGADHVLQSRAVAAGSEATEALSHYISAGSFPVSSAFASIFGSWETSSLITYERVMWWLHIVGILAFLNYVPYSKHFHIFLAFPNVWYSKLKPRAEIDNLAAVQKEVELMMDPSADPYAAPPADAAPPERFGAKDVQDLNWKQLMDAYSCTECGRCTDNCPANQTGKLLSPRKIMMDTRDRVEEVGKTRKDGVTQDDGKSLLRDFISEEELWACTTCNACTDACPVNIDPMSIIMDMRRYLIMEESKSPEPITAMFNNIENNGAPWAFPAADRDKWREDV